MNGETTDRRSGVPGPWLRVVPPGLTPAGRRAGWGGVGGGPARFPPHRAAEARLSPSGVGRQAWALAA